MRARIRTRLLPLALSALALALAVLQRPGWSSSDTKIDLHVDPIRFLGEISALWTPSSGLGGVESAQYAGYLFPMGPFFAAGHWLGLSDWLVDRLWLGLLLAIGCWGTVRLVERLGATTTPLGAAVAGLAYLLNPYVVVFSNRTTITLLAYALMPWLVLVALRGVRSPTRWRWAAVFALLVTSSGGGVNAAVVALVLVAPVALVVFEAATRSVAWRALWQFGWRAALLSLLASLWWIAPTAAQTRYGVDFLRFTEPAGAIWATTSLSESFRAMGYWIGYIGVGFNGVVRPYFSDAATLLFNHVVVTASLLVPGLALLGFTWTRRRRYAAYFLLLVLLGTLVMAVGFPEGTPLRRGATFAYNHVASVRFLRTTYKAGPLVVLGVAGLGGMAIEMAAARRVRAAIAVVAVALLAVAAWPFTTGKAVDKVVSWKQVPAGWRAAARDLDAQLGDNARAAVLPGQLYAFYRWGGTVDPIMPSLMKKPVAVRNAVPYSDFRATDLLWTADSLLQQGRLLPRQLPPLLRLMDVRYVVSATDDDIHRSGAVDPLRAERSLAAQGLDLRRDYGDGVRSFSAPAPRPLVRVEPRRELDVVDGSADGLADLAADAALPRGSFAYAGDLDPGAIRAAAAGGARVVVSDSNRRRVFVISRMQQNTGWTLGARDPISQDAATLDPFQERGTDAQTVAVLHGARSITAPFSPGYSQFPEHRPFAAFDGNPRTAWLADPALEQARHSVTITFDAPRDVGAIDVLPRNEAGARVDALVVDGKRFPVGSGWTHLPLRLKGARALTIRVAAAKTGSAGAGGLAEVRIPGVHVTESLRPPVLAERALRGAKLAHAQLDYSFSRVAGDYPLQHSSSAGVRVRQRVTVPERLEQLRVAGAGDGETSIDRVIEPPAARSYGVSGWASVLPEAADSSIDRLVGAASTLQADSSARLDGRAGARASSALDGNPATAWVAPWPVGSRGITAPDGGQPWLRVRLRRPLALRALDLVPAAGRVRRPARVRLAWPGGASSVLEVTGDRIELPRTVRAREFTLTVLAAAGRGRGVGIAELQAPGLPRIAVPRRGPLRGCGALAVLGGSAPTGLRVEGDIADLDAGRPLRVAGCGKLALGAGTQRIRVPARVLQADKLLLSSPAPNPLAHSALAAGGVTDAGQPGRGSRDHVRLHVALPSWLVLGESYDKGWRAWCDGRSLGQPIPLDGFANAWPVERGCTNARFAFAPQKPVHAIQIFSAVVCLLLLAFALAGGRLRPRRAGVSARETGAAERTPSTGRAACEGSAASPPAPAPAPLPLARSIAVALVAGGILAFCFSLRSGLLIAPAIALVLWRGIGARPLAFLGGLCLAVAVPLDYLLFPAKDLGGYNPGYANDQLAGHWFAVAAWVLLALALFRVVSTASRRRRGASAGPADAAA